MPPTSRQATALPLARLIAFLLLIVFGNSLRGDDTPAVPYFRSLAWTGQAYVGVTTEAVHTSADGLAWNVVKPSTAGLWLVAAGNGRVVAAGDQVLLSADGTGTDLAFSEHAESGAKFSQLAFGGGVFVALDEQGRAFVGNGSTAWKAVVVASGYQFKGLAYGNGLWVATGADKSGSAVFTASDPGAAWTRGSIPADTGPYGAAFSEGKFLIAGFKGLLLTSTDGKNWEKSSSPDLAKHDDLTGVFSWGDRFYVQGSALYTLGDGGTWEPVPQPDDTYLQTPFMKDDGLMVVMEDADRGRTILALGEVERQGMVGRHYGEQEYIHEPTPLDLKVDRVTRLTAWDGAQANRFATSTEYLYAATSKGLFRSKDGMVWEHFGGIEEPVDLVAATQYEVAIATQDGLSTATTAEGKFMPVAAARGKKIRDLRGNLTGFAVYGEGNKVLLGAGDEWREMALEGVSRIVGLNGDRAESIHAITLTDGGVDRFYVSTDSSYPIWLPFRGIEILTTTGTLALFGGGPGLTLGELDGSGEGFRLDGYGDTAALATGLDGSEWLATPTGLVAGISAGKPWLLHLEKGAEFMTVFDAGGTIIAGGKRGALLLIPKPLEGASVPTPLPSNAVSLLPKDLKFPVGTGVTVYKANRGLRFDKVKSMDGRIYAVDNMDRFIAWDGREWKQLEFISGATSKLRDFTIHEGKLTYVSEAEVFQTSIGYAQKDRVGRNYMSSVNPYFLHLFQSDGQYLAIGGMDRISLGDNLDSLWPRAIGHETLFHAAARGAGVWVVVGGKGSDHREPAILVGTTREDLALADLPVTEGSLRAVLHDGRRFVAVGNEGYVFTSENGREWMARQIECKPALTEIAYGAGLYGAASDKGALFVSDDLATWTELPKDPKFELTHIAGTPRELIAFGDYSSLTLSTPPSRWSGVQTFASSERRTVLPTPLPTVVVVATPAPTAAPTPVPAPRLAGSEDEAFAHILADWDRATTNAPSAVERQKLCEKLLHDWTYSNHNYTTDEAMAFTQALYDRLMTYEMSDYSLAHFLLGITEISNDFSKAYVQTLPAHTKTIVNQLMTDIVNDHEAQWDKNIKPHPVRIAASQKPAQPQVSPAEMDMDELRLRAAKGDKVAAYDLNFCYRIGQGVPLDVAAAAFWTKRALTAGFKPPSGPTATLEDTFSIYRQGAEQGSAMAQNQVGLYYRDGQGVTRDTKEAVTWLKRAVEGGHLGAACELAILYRLGNGIKANPEECLRLLTFASTKGHARAMAELGYCHEIGWGVARDLNKAADNYQKAADRGNSWATLRLVDLLLVGEGMARDEARARRLLQGLVAKGDASAKRVQENLNASKHQAIAFPAYTATRVGIPIFDVAACRAKAEAGDPGACYDMAFACWNSHGIPLEENIGDLWLAKAKSLGFKMATKVSTDEEVTASWKLVADQGSMIGLWYWGQRLRDGTGSPVDHASANAAFKRAVDAGSWSAAIDLANQLRLGRGLPADPTAAIGILENAASKGSAAANASLAWSYEASCGVRRDLAKAAAYYQKAADAGQIKSITLLAEYYLCGYGVPRDEVRAKALLQKAASFGDSDAAGLLELVKDGSYRKRALLAFKAPKRPRALFDVAARRSLAEAGDAAACFDMAWTSKEGFGQEPDAAEAAKWLERAKAKGWKDVPGGATEELKTAAWKSAAEQGSNVGAFEYGAQLFNGKGTPVDQAGAVSWIQKAANAGHASAQTSLAKFHEFGNAVVNKDEAKAVDWYLRAAQSGNAESQMKVGFYHDTGFQMPVNKELAVQFYQLAAEGGNKVGMANLAVMLTNGSGTLKDVNAAASWYLEMAGLLSEPVEPAEAYKQIQIALFDGHPEVLPVLAIMDRRAFGTVLDNTLAAARALAAGNLKSSIYELGWFDPNALQTPAALRMAADYTLDGLVATIAATNPGNKAVVRAKTMKSFEKIFEECANAETSKVAAFLRALQAGTLTDAQIAEASRDSEPLNLAGIEALWGAAKKEFPAGTKPTLLRLAGVRRTITTAEETESVFLGELVANPKSLPEDKRLYLSTLRRLQVARCFYGIGCTRDRTAALTWALINSDADESYSPITFLLRQVNIVEILDADMLYKKLASGANADFPQDSWILAWLQHAADEAAEAAATAPKP